MWQSKVVVVGIFLSRVFVFVYMLQRTRQEGTLVEMILGQIDRIATHERVIRNISCLSPLPVLTAAMSISLCGWIYLPVAHDT